MIGMGMHGFVANKEFVVEDLDKALNEPTDRRIFYLAQALENGYTVDRLHELTKIDRWFLHKLDRIKKIEKELAASESLTTLSDELLKEAKIAGFSDFQITVITSYSIHYTKLYETGTIPRLLRCARVTLI